MGAINLFGMAPWDNLMVPACSSAIFACIMGNEHPHLCHGEWPWINDPEFMNIWATGPWVQLWHSHSPTRHRWRWHHAWILEESHTLVLDLTGGQSLQSDARMVQTGILLFLLVSITLADAFVDSNFLDRSPYGNYTHIYDSICLLAIFLVLFLILWIFW